MGKIRHAFWARLNFGTAALLLLALFILVYLVLLRYDARYDWTKDRIFTLSPKTVEVLKDLGAEPITVKAFFKEDQPGREELEDLLKMYANANSRFRYEFLDPDRYPGQSKIYNVDEYGTIVIERKDRRERVRDITEEDLTNALLKLTEARQKTICFTKGHGERKLEDTSATGYGHFYGKLGTENYIVQEVLLSREAIPPEADLVVVAGPQSDFLPEEMQSLRQYLEKGGGLLLLLDPPDAPLEQFTKWLKEYGIILGHDVIIDKLSRVFGGDYLIPIVTQYGDHAITQNFNVASFLPYACSVTAVKEVPEGYRVTELAFTSQGSWAERDWAQIKGGEVTFDETDLAGPIALSAVVEKKDSKMKLVVFGDSDFADNAHFYLSGNKDLILNSVAWAAGEEKLVTIRGKGRESAPLILSARQQKILFIVPVIALPLLSFGTGLAVLLFRKRYS